MKHATRLPNRIGRCYCGSFQYQLSAPFDAEIQCHCRSCRYVTGGLANAVGLIKCADFQILKGKLTSFVKKKSKTPRRYFCPICGTHVYAESPARPEHFVLKVGTLDDPSYFFPQLAQFCSDKLPFDTIPDGVPSFEKRKPLE